MLGILLLLMDYGWNSTINNLKFSDIFFYHFMLGSYVVIVMF